MKSTLNNSITPQPSTELAKSQPTPTTDSENQRRTQALIKGIKQSIAQKPKVY